MYSYKITEKNYYRQQDVYTRMFGCTQSIQKKTHGSSYDPE